MRAGPWPGGMLRTAATMKVEGAWRRTIELAPAGDAVIVLDQTALPHRVRWLRVGGLGDAEPAHAVRYGRLVEDDHRVARGRELDGAPPCAFDLHRRCRA